MNRFQTKEEEKNYHVIRKVKLFENNELYLIKNYQNFFSNIIFILIPKIFK